MARYKAGIETRSRILIATRELLAEEGFEATTLKAICLRSEIQSGSFYNLFPSKDEAVLTVLREAITAVDPDPAGEGTDTISELTHAYVDFITGDPSLAKVYLQMAASAASGEEHLRARVVRHHLHRVRRFAEAIGRERTDLSASEAEYRAQLLIAALNGLVLEWTILPEFDFKTYADALIRERVNAP